jgi:hypothetical protein
MPSKPQATILIIGSTNGIVIILLGVDVYLKSEQLIKNYKNCETQDS